MMMKPLLVIGVLASLAQPLSAQTVIGRWNVHYDQTPGDILAGDTVPVADPGRHGTLEIEARGDSIVARWNGDASSQAPTVELHGTWQNGSLRLVSVQGVTVHPVVNGKEMSIDLFTIWDGQLLRGELRGTMSSSSKDGMVNGGTRAFMAKRVGASG